MKPIIAISMGDPAGIGPEIIAAALNRDQVHKLCRPLVIGDASVMHKAVRYAGTSSRVRGVTDVAQARFDRDTIDVYDLKNVDIEKLEPVSYTHLRAHETPEH